MNVVSINRFHAAEAIDSAQRIADMVRASLLSTALAKSGAGSHFIHLTGGEFAHTQCSCGWTGDEWEAPADAYSQAFVEHLDILCGQWGYGG